MKAHNNASAVSTDTHLMKGLTISVWPGRTSFRAVLPAKFLVLLNKLQAEELPMDTHLEYLDPKVLQRLVKEIGRDNTLKFMDSLDSEFQKRITNIRLALEENSFESLAAEAHALKSSAQISGAHKLADKLIQLEVNAKQEDEEAFVLAREAITMADLTRFAFLEVKLND